MNEQPQAPNEITQMLIELTDGNQEVVNQILPHIMTMIEAPCEQLSPERARRPHAPADRASSRGVHEADRPEARPVAEPSALLRE
jgi:hypothetical protein